METLFQVGDKVEHVITGEVGEIDDNVNLFRVIFAKRRAYFFMDGKNSSTDKYPSIRLIERPKRMVKKEAKVYFDKEDMVFFDGKGFGHKFFIEGYTGGMCYIGKIPVTISWEEEE